MVETRSMKKKRKSKNYSNLPFDLTLLIMQQLSFKDNIRASVVCKTWNEACVSVRVKDPTPWLMVFPKDEEACQLYELFDPSLEKTHTCKSPLELRGSHVEHCRDGWLLISDKDLTKTLFFNPFTQERIDLPWPDMCPTHPLAFSCAPTSNSCVIFSVYEIKKGSIIIKLYNLATKVCTPLTLPHRLPLRGGFEHVVFSNGVFYCLNDVGWLGMFSISTNSWSVLPRLRTPKCDYTSPCRFMTEYQGDILLIYTNKDEDFKVTRYLKLDLANRKWKDDRTLKGLSFFLSFKSTLTTNGDLVETKRTDQFVVVYGKQPSGNNIDKKMSQGMTTVSCYFKT
ncbi:unnamed protein product [Microthlaspi erraticum]|uniref:Uncharacterized protein n=1 Tax=Microthlaspi erraticum TaxID=1685480 RepID=A0A6D2KEU6_9BRAS|nr:unnamed protein product [Microthlaspi erraticum]